jgi:hypothetical protein
MFEPEASVTVTKEDAPYASEDQLGEYVFRRWTWREKQDASLKATTILDAKKNLIQTNVVEYEMQMLITSLKKAPFPIEDKDTLYERLNRLDPAVGDKVIAVCRKVNGITTAEQRNLSEPSAQGKDTSGSPSTGSVPP